MRSTFLIAVLLLAGSARGQDFAVATPVGDPISPSAFKLRLGNFVCTLQPGGSGSCVREKKAWRFLLPTGDGSIERVFVASGSDPVVVYEVSDDESNWAYIARLETGRKRPLWHERLSGLNTAAPLHVADTVIVAALSYIGAFEISNGLCKWQHDWVYSSDAGTDVRLELSGQLACYRSRLYDSEDRLVQCFDVNTGLSARPPASPER